MSIILSKTLENVRQNGVDAFKIYEINLTDLRGGNDSIVDLGSPNTGVPIFSWIGNYAGTGIEHYIHQKDVGEYATVLALKPNIPRESLRSFNVTLGLNNISGYNPDVSGVVGIRTSDEQSSYSVAEYFTTDFSTSPVYDLGGNTSKQLLSDPDFRTSLNLTSLVSGIIFSETYTSSDAVFLTFQQSNSSAATLRTISVESATISYYAVPPSKPLLPIASGGDASAFLTWQQPADNGGHDVTRYNIEYYNQTVGTGWSKVATAATGTSAYIYDLINDNKYYFRVSATNGAGTGPFSDDSNSVILEEPIFVTPLDFNHANYTRIRIRRDISTNWTGINPILAIGEAAYETDTRLLKIGDNSTRWNDLGYVKVDNDSIDFPAPSAVNLVIGDSPVNADNPRVNINLSNNEKLNIVGTGGVTVNYDNSFNALTFSLDKVFSPFTTGVLHSPATQGKAGDVYYDEKYVYICVSINSWKRIALPSVPWFMADQIDVSNIDGTYASATSIYFSGSNLIVTSDGDPYPAKAGGALINDGVTSRGAFFNNFQIEDQDYNFQIQYRGGTNTFSPEAANTGFLGVFANGVVLSPPGASGEAIGLYAAPSGFVYNRSHFSSYFNMDDCAGYVNIDRQYAYYNGKFLKRCWDDAKVYNSNPYYSGSNYYGDYYRHEDGHSKILGFAFDGYPIYGPFGYESVGDSNSNCALMISSYITKTTDDHRPVDHKYTNAISVNDINYNLTAGAYLEDFEYAEGSGLLDQYNGRYAVTPEYPQGTYAYYLTFTSSGLIVPAYPYAIGPFTKEKKVNQNILPSLVPLTVDGYYPLFLDINSATNYGLLNGGDGSYHTHTILGQLYYMPNGVPRVHPEAPTDLALSNSTISEKATIGSIIGTLSTTDANDKDSFTYSLVTGVNDTDNDNFNIVNNELRVNSILSYGIKPTHNIRLRTTDQTNRFFEKDLSISVVEGTTLTSLSIVSGTTSLLGGSGNIFGSTVVGTANDLQYSWSIIGSPYASGLASNTGSFYSVGTTNVPQRNDESVNVSVTVSSVSAFTSLTDTTSFLLDHSESPVCIEGYYPLYSSEYDSNRDPNGNGTSHQHTVNQVIYWMPNGLSEFYHGGIDCESISPAKTEICLDGSIDVTIVNTGDGNRYVFDGNSSNTHKFKATAGTYVFNNVPSNHPIAFHNNNKPIAYSGTTSVGSKTALDGNTYTYYYGNVTGVFNGDFSTTSYECYYHGYMGGQDNLIYDNTCVAPAITLTSTQISALGTVNGGSSITLTASKTGTASDVTYAWTVSSANGVTLSSSTGSSVTLNTTDLDQNTDQNVTVSVTATSVAAGTSTTDTHSVTVVQSSDSTTDTLTSVTISSNTSVNGGSSVALSSTVFGTATDVVYTWSINSVTGASLSSSNNSSTTLNTTDLDQDTDQTVIVSLTATSASAGNSVSATRTITILQSADSSTPTLTSVNISSATSVNGGSNLSMSASAAGTATDVTYAWSFSLSANGAALSSSTGSNTTLTTTNYDTDSNQTVTVLVTATSASAGTSVTDTQTITISQSADTPTLTGVTISGSTTVNGGSSVSLTATRAGTATDVVYSWSVTSATGVSLSSGSGSSVVVYTTDLNQNTDQSVTVQVTATSSSASSTVNDTHTITIYQSSDGGGGYGGGYGGYG
tara:strand:- start:6835 stop:11790 length:4956 start_codon:yes stop_codon:yes gene_type:complete